MQHQSARVRSYGLTYRILMHSSGQHDRVFAFVLAYDDERAQNCTLNVNNAVADAPRVDVA